MKPDLEKKYDLLTAPRSIRWFLSALYDEIEFEIRKALNLKW